MSEEFCKKYDDALWSHHCNNNVDLIIGGEFSRFKILRCSIPVKIRFIESNTHFFENYQTAIVELDETPIITFEKISLNRSIGRLQGFLTIFSEFTSRFPHMLGSSKKLLFAYGDNPCNEKCVCFCSNKDSDFLIPDFEFVNSYGYKHLHKTYQESIPWIDRLDKAYWRGADTSTRNYKLIENSPRIRVSLLAKQHESYIDAGIVSIENTKNFDIKKQLYDFLGIYKKPEPQETILNYRYQIDIDGNTNAWKGFYVKLLSGSPVLKVDSEFNFKQWYYHRLIPWVHYVPVKYDCSDLIEKIDFLRKNPLLAEYIGIEGQKFALNMTYEQEVNVAVGILMKAFNQT
jgi:hypothetical protein